MTILPSQNGKYRVAHGRNGFADIVRTRNLDFRSIGNINVAQSPVVLYTNGDNANFSSVQSIVADSTYYYVITSNRCYSLVADTLVFAELTTTNMPTMGVWSDAVAFNSEVVASGSNSISGYASSAWTNHSITTSSSYPHPLCVFINRNELAIGDGNTVKTYNTSYSLQNTLTIPAQFTVTWMRWMLGDLYIGTRNTAGGDAMMFRWNGTGTSAQQGYSIKGDWIYSGTVFQDTIVVLASSGQLLRFNGGGFTEVAHFPIYETQFSWVSSASATSLNGKCPNRSMLAGGDIIYINIDGSIGGQGNAGYPGAYLHDQPSGLWIYDPQIGLYHTAGYPYTKYNTLTISSAQSGYLNFASAHLLETGDEIRAASVSNITGLTTGRDYFAIKVDTTTIQLAFSPADAYAGRNISFSGTVSGDTINVSRTNRGGVSSTLPGAMCRFSRNETQPFFGSRIFFGGQAINNANTNVKSLMSFGRGRNVGNFITSQFPSSQATDFFKKLYINVDKLYLDSQSIHIKYRTADKPGLPTPIRYSDTGLATWTSTTTFTVNTLTKNFQAAAVGDEIEITEGAGAGYTAHITAINTDSTTYTVTIDEAIPNISAADTSEVMVDNWKSLPTIGNTSEDIEKGIASVLADSTGVWIQFKIEIRGQNTPISRIASVSSVAKPLQ